MPGIEPGQMRIGSLIADEYNKLTAALSEFIKALEKQIEAYNHQLRTKTAGNMSASDAKTVKLIHDEAIKFRSNLRTPMRPPAKINYKKEGASLMHALQNHAEKVNNLNLKKTIELFKNKHKSATDNLLTYQMKLNIQFTTSCQHFFSPPKAPVKKLPPIPPPKARQ
jgi:hypothetical protein